MSIQCNGYQVIPIEGIQFTAGTAKTIPGLYDLMDHLDPSGQIDMNTKPFLVPKHKIGSGKTVYPDYISPYYKSSKWQWDHDGYHYEVTSADALTVNQITTGTATKTVAGTVKQAAACAAAAGTAPTKAEFDAVITALKNAGIMATS